MAITIVCAIKDELNAINAGLAGSTNFVVKRAGVGLDSAARCAAEILPQKPTVLISSGFCGGLDNSLALGDTVISTEVIDARSGQMLGFPRAEEFAGKIWKTLNSSGIKCWPGKLISTPTPAFSPDDKRAIAAKFSAIAIDMESAALFAPFAQTDTICIALRVLSDTVIDDLPPEVGEFLDESGKVRAAKVTRFLLKKPTKNITRLLALKRNAERASAELTKIWAALREIEK